MIRMVYGVDDLRIICESYDRGYNRGYDAGYRIKYGIDLTFKLPLSYLPKTYVFPIVHT